jgi:hypothetical protein
MNIYADTNTNTNIDNNHIRIFTPKFCNVFLELIMETTIKKLQCTLFVSQKD